MKRSLLFIIILTAVLITSCNMIGLMLEDDRDSFVGVWEDEWDTTFVFEENGKCEISEAPIGLKWSIDSDDNELKIWSVFWVFSIKADYNFLDSETLEYTITDLSILAREWYSAGESNYLYKR